MALWLGMASAIGLTGCGRRHATVALPAVGGGTVVASGHDDARFPPAAPAPRNGTVAQRLRQYGASARQSHAPYFQAAGVAYPPAHLVLLGLKEEQALEVYAAGKDGVYHFIRAYPIQAESGALGPKLREGDYQVPEGIYGISLLNPNSNYHLSMEVSYPNDFDRAMARRDKRTHLGSAIMIHGDARSAGCLAMGDGAAEDLFVLAEDTGLAQIKVILSPVDFRCHKLPDDLPKQPAWVSVWLYAQIQAEMRALPLPLPWAGAGK